MSLARHLCADDVHSFDADLIFKTMFQ